MRLAYVVSRFPLASETFILRELNALEDEHGWDVALLALFAPQRPFAHPDAARWLPRVARTTLPRGAQALARWLRRRPGATLRVVASILRGYARRPALLVRALVTLVLAADHAERLERGQVDHVHAHFATYPALAAWVAHRLTGASFSLTAHAHDLFVDRSHLGAVLDEAAFVVTISEFNRRFLRLHGLGTATPTVVVRCGVLPERYAVRPDRPPPVESVVRCLCVASLEEYKGHATLLDALSRTRHRGRLQLDLVGGGSLAGPLAARARALGIADRVRFLGPRTEGEVAALLAAADLFVLASVVARDGQMEGIPVALMEALACAVPTIASDLSGIPELVQDDVTGVLVEPGDADALARAIDGVLDDPAAARRRALAGRALVERDYDVRTSAQALDALFRSLPPRPRAT